MKNLTLISLLLISLSVSAQQQTSSILIFPLFKLQSIGWLTQTRVTNHGTMNANVTYTAVCGRFGTEPARCSGNERLVTIFPGETDVRSVETFMSLSGLESCETGAGWLWVELNGNTGSNPWALERDDPDLSGSAYFRRTVQPFPNATAGYNAYGTDWDTWNDRDLPGSSLEGLVLTNDARTTSNEAQPFNGRRLGYATADLRAVPKATNTTISVDIDMGGITDSREFICHDYLDVADIPGADIYDQSAHSGEPVVPLTLTSPDEAVLTVIEELEPNRSTARQMLEKPGA